MNFFDFIRFIFRNPTFAASNVRQTSEYRKVMKKYRDQNPVCEFCGIEGGKVDVHHKIPVSVAPQLACDENNLVTLHRKPQCHLIVGHFGSWRRYNPRVEATCLSTKGYTDDCLKAK